jgi:hypothetical protein
MMLTRRYETITVDLGAEGFTIRSTESYRWRDIEAAWMDPGAQISFRVAGCNHQLPLGGFAPRARRRILAEFRARTRFVHRLEQPIF